jgi:hypothetical protein
MPKADSHEAAAQAARQAADKLAALEAGKRAVAVDKQQDRFARTAAHAAATWNKGR